MHSVQWKEDPAVGKVLRDRARQGTSNALARVEALLAQLGWIQTFLEMYPAVTLSEVIGTKMLTTSLHY